MDTRIIPNLPELVIFLNSTLICHVYLPLLFIHHVIDAFLWMTLFICYLRSHNQKLFVLALTLFVLLSWINIHGTFTTVLAVRNASSVQYHNLNTGITVCEINHD